MTSKENGTWNSLEVTKLAASFLTPLLLFYLAFIVNQLEVARKASEDERIRTENRQAAVQEFSRFIYERRSRSALLLSALLRHTCNPVPESKQEVIERKRLYDEAYFNWNAHYQANLLLIRQILDSSEYSVFEAMVQSRLVKKTFTPIDECLTKAYDLTIRGGAPSRVLAECGMSELIQRALDCGYVITDELFKLSGKSGSQELPDSTVEDRCP